MEPNGAAPGPAEPDDALCARYCRRKLWLAALESGTQLAALAALSLTGASRLLLDLDRSLGPAVLVVLVYLLQLGALVRLVALPWRWASGHLTERCFGLSGQTTAGWLWEWLCRSSLFGGLAVLLLYPVALTLPWWPVALGLWVLYFVGARAAYHHWLYAPLLHRLYPTRFLRHERFHLPGIGRRTLPVYEVRVSHCTRRVDAYLHLAGRRSAIYVTDTLIEEFTDGEEKIVMAHEFGHLYDRLYLEERTEAGIRQAKRKVWWGALQLVAVAGSFLAVHLLAPFLGMAGAGDLAAFPLLIALILGLNLLLAPALRVESRRDEADADEYALKVTGDVENYRSVLAKLRRMNLEEATSDPMAHFLFDTHPDYAERLRLADTIHPRRHRHRRRTVSARR